jgi:hypothetical protein
LGGWAGQLEGRDLVSQCLGTILELHLAQAQDLVTLKQRVGGSLASDLIEQLQAECATGARGRSSAWLATQASQVI